MANSVSTTTLASNIDVNRIMTFLPHRYPFLLVDRVVELVPNQRIQAYKCVTINESFFQGHFPGLPVMPGVLILEALAQAAGVMVLAEFEPELIEKSVFLFSGIENARFRCPVVPGDRLDLQCELIRQKRQLWKMTGVASVDGKVAAEATMTAALAPKERLL